MRKVQLKTIIHKKRHGNKQINKAHRERGQNAYRKSHCYSPQKAALAKQQEIEAKLRTQRKLEEYCERARTLTTKEEKKTLYREVWSTRHEIPAAVTLVDKIVKERSIFN